MDQTNQLADRPDLVRDDRDMLQRFSREWQSLSTDRSSEILEHLDRITAPSVKQFIETNHLSSVREASPEQTRQLADFIQKQTGISSDNAETAVLARRSHVDTPHERQSPQAVAEAVRFENLTDIYLGKAGPAARRDDLLLERANAAVGPVLEQYVSDHGVSRIHHLTERQEKKVVSELAKQAGVRVYHAEVAVSTAAMEDFHQHVEQGGRALDKAVGAPSAPQFQFKQESGEILSFEHRDTGRHVHLDVQGQFYNQHREPISASAAIHHAFTQEAALPEPSLKVSVREQSIAI